MPEKRKEDLYDYPNNPSIINPKYPLQSILTEAHMQNTLTSDMVSVTRAEGKIPIGDPNNDYKIRLDWLGLSEDATYTVDASESQKGVVKLASTNDVDTGTDHTKAVTPKGLKWGIDNAFQNNLASTEQPGTVKLTNTIISNENTTGYKTYAVTSKAVKDYITDNFAADIVNFGDYNNDIKPIISASSSSKYDVLATKPSYSKKSVNAYTLHRYLSDNDLYFNVSNQSIGGIIFRDRTETESVSTVEKVRAYVSKTSGNFIFKIGPSNGVYFYQTELNNNKLTGSNTKELILLNSSGNSIFPGTVTVGDFVYKSTSTTVGSTTKPIYIKNGKIAECSTIDNVNNADSAVKDGAGNVIANTYLPLAGGTMTGPIYRNDSSVTNGVVNVLWGQVATNDQWGIRAGGTASNSGYLELATGDDAQEPIYVRQYSGGGFATLKRTATLLDASGNTSFPGNVSSANTAVTGKFTVNNGTALANGDAVNIFDVYYKNTSGSHNIGGSIISIIGNNETDGYNNYLVSFGSDQGGTNINAGDQGKGFLKGINKTNTEDLSLTADGSIELYPNLQNYSSNSKYGGPMTITSAGVTTTGSKVNITGINTIDGKAANVTGTVAIANGGTGATDRLSALKNLTNQNVGTNATYFLTITGSWETGGYTSVANAKTVLGLSNYLPLAGGTMTGNITRSMSSVTRGTAPSSTVYNSAYVRDSKNNAIGLIETKYATDKSSATGIYAYKTTAATGNNIGSMGIGCDASGAVYTWAPTPASGDNSTKIATTAFVKNILANASVSLNSTKKTGLIAVAAAKLERAKGWIVYENGYIVQWQNSVDDGITFTYPVPMKTCFTVQVQLMDTGNNEEVYYGFWNVGSITATSCKLGNSRYTTKFLVVITGIVDKLP